VTGARYAVYFAPAEDSALNRLASRWLGRCAYTGTRYPPTGVGEITPAAQEEITAEPRRYGFHATLKPPFRLPQGRTATELLTAVESFAAARPRIILPGLRVARLGRFLALVPERASPELEALAADCVVTFDRFRAPPGEAELARRRSRDLTRRQEELLLAWGYPYVMEEFRFHMTLTGPLAPETGESVLPALQETFDPVCGTSFVLDALTVFGQFDPAGDFRVVARYPLGEISG